MRGRGRVEIFREVDHPSFEVFSELISQYGEEYKYHVVSMEYVPGYGLVVIMQCGGE